MRRTTGTSRALLGLGAALALAGTVPAQAWREEVRRIDRDASIHITWQRSLDDARAISRRTGRPLLICVNMDQEPASEAFAHRKYKDETFAELVSAFVPLILSPTRHNAEDYDTDGRRVSCPRFGTVTCGEHITAEPPAYERYFGGQRYAPRHIGVSPDGSVLFDLYLLQDLRAVDNALRRHGVEPSGAWRGLFASRDVADRERIERAYRAGDVDRRHELLEVAASCDTEPYDLIRLGLSDSAPALRGAAARALARTAGSEGLDLLLATISDDRYRSARGELLGALERIGRDDERARKAWHNRKALESPSRIVDAGAWLRKLRDATTPDDPPTHNELGPLLDRLITHAKAHPEDGETLLAIAATNLAFARAEIARGGNPMFFLLDADGEAERAVALGVRPAAAAAVRAQATWLNGEPDTAAKQAVLAIPFLLHDAGGRTAAEVLNVLAAARTRAIYDAEAAGVAWPASWLGDAVAAYEALAAHPLGTIRQATAEADLLAFLGLRDAEGAVLRAAIRRTPASPELHQRFRGWIENTRTIPALTAAYEELRKSSDEETAASFDWFSGYAELIVAEHHMRRDEFAAADKAYARAIELLDSSVAERAEYADSVDHFAALALAGQARAAVELDRLELAVDHIASSIERRPATAELQDGLGREPIVTLRRLRSALQKAGRADLDGKLAERLGNVAPEVWQKAAPAGS